MENWLIPFRHNAWATRRMLELCRTLSNEQFHRRFEIGLSNLHDTFDHIIGAMARWSDRIGGQPLRPLSRNRDQTLSIDELQAMLTTASRDLEAAARSVHDTGRLDEMMEFPMPDGSKIHFTRAAALAHITTHGMHHRAQAMNMLRHVGVKLDRDFDPVEWELSLAPDAR